MCILVCLFHRQVYSLNSLYIEARQVRALQGHAAAQPLYQELLNVRNDASAATWIAAHPESPKRHDRLGDKMTAQLYQRILHNMHHKFHYTPDAIADLLFKDKRDARAKALESSAPLYLQPLRAGASPPPLPTCPLSTCLQLFSLSVCLPVSICDKYLGRDTMDDLETCGMAFRNGDMVVPYCHVTPVRFINNQILFFTTDLHPDVLSMTSVGEHNHGTVMYIGPDSIALMDHWNANIASFLSSPQSIVDIGSGSGILALSAALALQDSGPTNVTCVDINPRALDLTSWNFVGNGFKEPRLLLGDILESSGGTDFAFSAAPPKQKPWVELLQDSTLLLANPPFLPVPIDDPEISERYGYFSSGGANGEDVLKAIVQLASRVINGGYVAIVSEFMNPHTTLIQRFETWWRETEDSGSEGAAIVLCSNQQAMQPDIYAQRRADSQEEVERWFRHLKSERIDHISPGLLFARKDQSLRNEFSFEECLIQKTEHGSIWTPSNRLAKEQTKAFFLRKWGLNKKGL